MKLHNNPVFIKIWEMLDEVLDKSESINEIEDGINAGLVKLRSKENIIIEKFVRLTEYDSNDTWLLNLRVRLPNTKENVELNIVV